MRRALLARGWPAIVLAFVAAGAALGSFLPRLDVDASTSLLLNEDDPDLAYYNATRPQWSYDEYAIVSVRREDWFTPEGVAFLSSFVDELLRAPHVRSVTSILSVPLLRNRPAGLLLLTGQPLFLADPQVRLERAREELLAHTQAQGNLLSADGRDVSLLVHLDIPEELERLEAAWAAAQAGRDRAAKAALEEDYERASREFRARRRAMVAAVREIAGRRAAELGEPIYLSGLPIINVNLVEHVVEDLRNFGAASLAFFVLAFAAAYRKARWTVLPILTALLPVVLVVGTMALAGRKITVITSNLPVLLFVLVLPYTVYFIERYRERRARSPGESGPDASSGAAREIWVPCFYSAATTMVGFASLTTSGINPVRTFGAAMSAGIGVGLACAMLFLPALAAPWKPLAVPAAGPEAGARGPVRIFERVVRRAPGAVVAAAALVLGLSFWGVLRLRVETKFVDYFHPSSEIYRGLEYIDARMGGTTPLEVVLTAREPGFFRTDAGLEAIQAVERYFGDPARGFADGVPETGNVRSLRTLLEEVRKAFRTMSVEQLARIQAARSLVREFADEDFTVTRVLVRFRETAPTLHRNDILKGLRAHLEREPALRDLEVRPTGVFLLYANMLNSLLKSQRDTFLIVLGAIFAMLLVLFRSPALATVVLIPQVLPALACVGAMGWTGIPLDLVTVMVASIAMGVGIDAAIQYTVRYRRELEATGGDRAAAVSRAHATIGRAIWIATSIVVTGFAVLVLSRFVPTVTFGLLTALAMLMSQFAALTVLPSLFLLLGGLRLARPTKPVPEESASAQ